MGIEKSGRSIKIMQESRNQVFSQTPAPHSPLPTPYSPPENGTRTGERVVEQKQHGVGQINAVVTAKANRPPIPHSLRVTPRTPWLFLSLLLLFILSCKTTPNIPDEALIETGIPLDSGAVVYIVADAKRARSIIDILPIEELNDSQTRQMMERTVFFVAALFPRESGRRFQLAAWGNYPSFRAGMAFTFNRQWQKRKSETGQSFWYSGANRLSISMDAKQAFAASSLDDTPYYPAAAAPGIKPPEGFNEFRRNAEGITSPLSCWLEDPAPMINRMIGGVGIPIQIPAKKLMINLFPASEDGQYEASVRIQFESAIQARGIAAVLSLAGNFVSGGSGQGSILALILFSNPPVLNGNYIDIKTDTLSKDEISGLFQMFLLY